jgi:hypothetical protein
MEEVVRVGGRHDWFASSLLVFATCVVCVPACAGPPSVERKVRLQRKVPSVKSSKIVFACATGCKVSLKSTVMVRHEEVLLLTGSMVQTLAAIDELVCRVRFQTQIA